MSTPTFQSNLRRTIDTVMESYPDLSSTGFRASGNDEPDFERLRKQMRLDNFEEMVADALVDLVSRPIGVNSSSYGYRNTTGRRLGRYATNGALIVAAVIAGYEPKPEGINCTFKRKRDTHIHPSFCGGDYTRGWESRQ